VVAENSLPRGGSDAVRKTVPHDRTSHRKRPRPDSRQARPEDDQVGGGQRAQCATTGQSGDRSEHRQVRRRRAIERSVNKDGHLKCDTLGNSKPVKANKNVGDVLHGGKPDTSITINLCLCFVPQQFIGRCMLPCCAQQCKIHYLMLN
jgi:hypothetical protein